VVEIDECIGLPEAVSQFIAGDDLAGSFQEHHENLKRLLGKLQAESMLAEFQGIQVYLEDPKTYDSRRSCRCAH